ncbi:hypothetical protein NDU88_006640 [Pleurodeles waltl]|uniref:Uncharacterized protein n=1 Tax=Pleurodeles waltl TaxID=8319 RepID=A0AAV7UM26_PLEWA|nr:hypothetical protein NDU88_006640 [Pleurodeles waltl]
MPEPAISDSGPLRHLQLLHFCARQAASSGLAEARHTRRAQSPHEFQSPAQHQTRLMGSSSLPIRALHYGCRLAPRRVNRPPAPSSVRSTGRSAPLPPAASAGPRRAALSVPPRQPRVLPRSYRVPPLLRYLQLHSGTLPGA